MGHLDFYYIAAFPDVFLKNVLVAQEVQTKVEQETVMRSSERNKIPFLCALGGEIPL